MSTTVLDLAAGNVQQGHCEDASSWLRRTLLLVGVLFAARLIYTALCPVDLVHDEAYYWDWSRALDWCYYSKPPMVAWLIALSTRLGVSTVFFVRLPAVILATSGLLLSYLLGARMYGPRVGFWAMVLAAATPGNAAMGLIMSIDAPFLFCWCAALYCLWRLLERRADRPIWLGLLVLTTGLGLLSKQTMIGFLPLAGLFLLVSPEDRIELRRPAVWLWAAGATLFLTPVLLWNAQHQWITFQHTSSHFAAEPVTWLSHLSKTGEFIASQVVVATPITWLLFATVTLFALRSFRRLERREKFLVCYSGLPLSAVFVLALRQEIQPNWPAAFYPAGLVLVAGWALGRTKSLARPQLGVRQLWRAAGMGIAFTLFAYLLPFGWGLEGSRFDPVVRLRGWQELGQLVGQRISAWPDRDRTLIIVTAGRSVTSELAFYVPQQPRTYLWSGSDSITSQYDLWGGPMDKHGWNAAIVTRAREEIPRELQNAFQRTELAGEICVPIGNSREHRFLLWRAVDLSHWPLRRSTGGEVQVDVADSERGAGLVRR